MPEPLRKAFDALLRGDPTDLEAFLRPVSVDVPVGGTTATVHGYMVRLGPAGSPRIKDLARQLAYRIVDFAIPRSEIARARELDARRNTQAATTALYMKARSLFAAVDTTGEPGELLLYVMAQAYLGMPQLFCKMPHKTNPAVHCHGADGIHASVGTDEAFLSLCFGQSKLHAASTAAIKGCLDDIKPYLCDEGGTDAAQERDLELMRDNLDLDDPALEEAILNYLTPEHPDFLKRRYRGICLAGFDVPDYAPANAAPTEDAARGTLTARLSDWLAKVAELIAQRQPLDAKRLDLFLVPVPSVQDLRSAFLEELGHGG